MLLIARQLYCHRGDKEVVRGIDLSVAQGDRLGILGPNGAGKSSLMLCLAGLHPISSGEILFEGKPLTPMSRRFFGVVFQDASLDPTLTVRANLELAGALYAMRNTDQRIKTVADHLNLSDVLDQRVDKLSGGMRRRVDLARALLPMPTVLFLDEPSNGLDPLALEQLWASLDAMRQAEQTTVIISTHRAEEAERCDRLVLMDQGNIVASGTPDELLGDHPREVVVVRRRTLADVFSERTGHGLEKLS